MHHFNPDHVWFFLGLFSAALLAVAASETWPSVEVDREFSVQIGSKALPAVSEENEISG